ncbi:wsc domain containing protein [Moniliophthora roreri MCA 2997]|uniref:Wsc domain containing protein n=2 Tax=Moniliophthora roreri TaxID=221103 RepID=V2WYS8_MONRO|nr:wsc domain containing protein [Moniliophthora roreri MCA 2997]
MIVEVWRDWLVVTGTKARLYAAEIHATIYSKLEAGCSFERTIPTFIIRRFELVIDPLKLDRAGRIDAKKAAPPGVPGTGLDTQCMLKKFAKMGFNREDMIPVVACGYILRGVHGDHHPDSGLTGNSSTDG